MTRIVRVLALLAVALAAGCGGGGDGNGNGQAEVGTLEEDIPNAVETLEGANLGGASEAGNICVNLPVPELARQYGVQPTKDAVADAVAKDIGGDAAKQERSREECLQALG